MKQEIQLYSIARGIVFTILFFVTYAVCGQTKADQLYSEGQTLAEIRTLASQNKAINKFKAAKVIYTTPAKKKLCDNQIAICYKNITALKKNSNKKKNDDIESDKKKVPEVLSLSKNTLDFLSDKNSSQTIEVTSPTDDWKCSFVESMEYNQNFVRIVQNIEQKTIRVEVESNQTTLPRKQGIKVYDSKDVQYIVVSQEGCPVLLRTNTGLIELKTKGGNKDIELYTNSDSIIQTNWGDLSWYLESKPEWVEIDVKKTSIAKMKDYVSYIPDGLVKKSIIKIVTRPIAKNSPEFTTGRKGEIVFASQNKTCKIIVLQQ